MGLLRLVLEANKLPTPNPQQQRFRRLHRPPTAQRHRSPKGVRYGIKLPAQIHHPRFDDIARQAVIADPTLVEALGPLLDARGHLYRA